MRKIHGSDLGDVGKWKIWKDLAKMFGAPFSEFSQEAWPSSQVTGMSSSLAYSPGMTMLLQICSLVPYHRILVVLFRNGISDFGRLGWQPGSRNNVPSIIYPTLLQLQKKVPKTLRHIPPIGVVEVPRIFGLTRK